MHHLSDRPGPRQKKGGAAVSLGAGMLLLGFGGLRAEVEWQARLVRLEPPAGAADVAGEFVFVNRGEAPVRLLEVRSSCDCTVMPVDRKLIQPGEKGRIPVVYHVGSRQGRQAVTIAVTTSEPELRNHELTLEVEIKDSALLTPRMLAWKLGDEPTAKVIRVTLAAGFRWIGAESVSPEFLVAAVGQAEQSVQFQVSPRDTWAKRNGLIKVRVAKGAQPPIEILAPVSVQ